MLTLSDMKKNLAAKMHAVNEEATVAQYVEGKKAEKGAAKINKLEAKAKRTAEEDKALRELKKENERIHENQRAAAEIMRKSGLAEKILKCYFAYKMTKLLLTPFLTPNVYGYGPTSYQTGHAIDEGISRAAEHEAEAVIEGKQPTDEERAQQIEDVKQAFQDISDEAMKQGLTDEPVFSDEDHAKLDDLATITRDGQNPEQAEQYAAKCQELGLDYDKALEAFQSNETISDVQNDIAIDRDAAEREASTSYEMEV